MADFIDLYAGIGGIRFAFERAGLDCVFSSEWNKYAQKTYEAFHGEAPDGDIHAIDLENEIPPHQVLVAGFPCQPFSLAGVSKKNSLGIAHGFDDPTQGTEFFVIKEILRIHQPVAFLLENVKNLRSHDKGKTYEIICRALEDIGYVFHDEIIDASNWVPQHRERIYFAGVRGDLGVTKGEIAATFPEAPPTRVHELSDILETEEDLIGQYGDKYTLGPGTWETLERHRKHHASIGNGFGYGLIKPPFEGKVTRTMSARYHKDGAEILIQQEGRRPRRLTPLEACKLQGFPEECYQFFNGNSDQPVSDTQAYRQFGNSVAVPVVSAIANGLIEMLADQHLLELNDVTV